MDILGRERLAALGRGFELLGSGGGGGTTMMELMVADAPVWPLTVHAATDLDPGTPCVAAAFAGSTYLLAERIPAADVFDPLVEAAERWTGVGAAAVCALEGAGLNRLTPLLLAGAHALVDADFMGRALPRLDQLSLLVDTLDAYGYEAHASQSGTAALQWIEACGLPDLVVLDADMNLFTGVRTLAALIEHGYAGAVILLARPDAPPDPNELPPLKNLFVVDKPVMTQVLLRTMRKALEAVNGGS